METTHIRKRMPVGPAITAAFVKLNPRTLMKNPVMFVLEVVTALTTIILIRDLFTGGAHLLFEVQIVIWLWFRWRAVCRASSGCRGKMAVRTTSSLDT